MCGLSILLLWLLELFSGSNGLNTVTVSTPVGNIMGYTRTATTFQQNYDVQQFLGVPYAESTAGAARFRKPVPKANFQTTFDATAPGPACIQLQAISSTPPPVSLNVRYSEDCLVLNVFTPGNSNASSTYPVMVFIHGGAFVVGMSNTYDAGYMTGYGQVIVVTINYRLAELGFLSTGDSSAPGNMGLWDQHLAIKWVHNNIKSFGGDPSQVTIFGESAGSASVIYQAIYPGNKGLFARVVAESGSSVSPWAFTYRARSVNHTNNFASLFQCSNSSTSELVSCLQSKSTTQINQTMNTLGVKTGNVVWSPVLDNDFLMDIPNNIFSGKSNATAALEMFNSVDLMIGVNSKEGYLEWGGMGLLLNITDVTALKTIPKSGYEAAIIPYFTDIFYKKYAPNKVLDAVMFEYTDWTDPEDGHKRNEKAVDLVSDTFFWVPTVQTADIHRGNASAANRTTYMYKLSCKPPKHILYVPPTMDGPDVTNHADDLAFLLDDQGLNTKYDPVFNVYPKVAKAMMTMWTNFAKSGNPNNPAQVDMNTVWPEYGSENNFLEITAEMTSHSVQQNLAARAYAFWEVFVPSIFNGNKIEQMEENSLNV